MKVKDILNLINSSSVRLYKVTGNCKEFAFEGKPMHVPEALYDLPVKKLGSECKHYDHFISIYFSEKGSEE